MHATLEFHMRRFKIKAKRKLLEPRFLQSFKQNPDYKAPPRKDFAKMQELTCKSFQRVYKE